MGKKKDNHTQIFSSIIELYPTSTPLADAVKYIGEDKILIDTSKVKLEEKKKKYRFDEFKKGKP